MKQIFILLSVILIIGCTKQDKKTITFKLLPKDKSLYITDTLFSYPQSNCILVRIEVGGIFFDSFTPGLAFIKRQNNGSDIIYYNEMKDADISEIAYEKHIVYVYNYQGYSNWGWFYLQNGSITDTLPGISAINDSLSEIDKRYDIQDNSGSIGFYENQKLVKTIDYGTFVLKNKSLDVSRLSYGIYSLQKGCLNKISDNGNDLAKQINGVYYVPYPGYGAISLFSIGDILLKIDSVSKSKSYPQYLRFTSARDF